MHVLIETLPLDSAYRRSLTDHGMTAHELIVMGLFNLTQVTNYKVGLLGGEEAQPPKPLLPPGVEPEVTVTPADRALERAQKFLERTKRRREAE